MTMLGECHQPMEDDDDELAPLASGLLRSMVGCQDTPDKSNKPTLLSGIGHWKSNMNGLVVSY